MIRLRRSLPARQVDQFDPEPLAGRSRGEAQGVDRYREVLGVQQHPLYRGVVYLLANAAVVGALFESITQTVVITSAGHVIPASARLTKPVKCPLASATDIVMACPKKDSPSIQSPEMFRPFKRPKQADANKGSVSVRISETGREGAVWFQERIEANRSFELSAGSP